MTSTASGPARSRGLRRGVAPGPAPSPGTPRTRPADWLVPASLVLLALVPALAGAARVTELAGDPVLTDENARFVTAPAPVVVHVVAVTLYSMLGALQFSPGFRGRNTTWHRAAGTLLIPAGFATALSGLWMTAFYDLPAKDTLVVNSARYVVGTVMLAGLVLAVRALLRHDHAAHGAWMTRAYALAMGAGTQLVLLGPWLVLARPRPDDPAVPVINSILMTLAWVVNALLAEWIIRRRKLTRPSR